MVTEGTQREQSQMVSACDKCYQSDFGTICNHKPAHAPPGPTKETRVRGGEKQSGSRAGSKTKGKESKRGEKTPIWGRSKAQEGKQRSVSARVCESALKGVQKNLGHSFRLKKSAIGWHVESSIMATGKPKKHFAHDRVSSHILPVKHSKSKNHVHKCRWSVRNDCCHRKLRGCQHVTQWNRHELKVWNRDAHQRTVSYCHIKVYIHASSFMSTHKWQQSNLEQQLALIEIDRTSQGKNTWVIIMETAAGTHTCKRLRTHTCKQEHICKWNGSMKCGHDIMNDYMLRSHQSQFNQPNFVAHVKKGRG